MPRDLADNRLRNSLFYSVFHGGERDVPKTVHDARFLRDSCAIREIDVESPLEAYVSARLQEHQ